MLHNVLKVFFVVVKENGQYVYNCFGHFDTTSR